MQALWVIAVAVPLGAGAVAVWRHPDWALFAFVVGLPLHNSVMAALFGAGLDGPPLTLAQAWKEILLGAALASVAAEALRARAWPFRPMVVDWLALAYAGVVAVYSLIPQSVLGGAADAHGVALGAKHNLIPVGAYLLGRSLHLDLARLRQLAWTLLATAAAVAAMGLLDVFFISIDWWRRSAVPDYFNDWLGYDYHGTGHLPENFIYNTGSEVAFVRRLVSVFLSPLATAYMLVAALLLFAARGPLWARLRLSSLLASICAVALLYTFTRSAFLALAAGLFVLGYTLRRRWIPTLVLVLAVVGAALLWALLFPDIGPTGHWTAQDLQEQRQIAQQKGATSGSALNPGESSLSSHWDSLRGGVETILDHPQGYGVGNVGQTASRTGVEIKAGESNYTEMGAEMGAAGALAWAAWCAALLFALVMAGRAGIGGARWFVGGVAAAFGAMLAIAVQSDVIGDPWVGYCIWAFAGVALALGRSDP